MLIIVLKKEKMKCLHAYIFADLICIINIAGHIGMRRGVKGAESKE